MTHRTLVPAILLTTGSVVSLAVLAAFVAGTTAR